LRDLGDAPARRHREVAGVGLQTAGEEREEGRLAGAVAPDEADLLAGLDGERGAVEDELDAAAQRDLGQNEHARLSRGGLSAAERAPFDEDHAVVAAARLEPGAFEARERALEVVALVADLDHEDGVV